MPPVCANFMSTLPTAEESSQRPERAQSRDDRLVHVTVERRQGEVVRRLKAEMLDLSTGGAKLRVSELLRLDEKIDVRIETHDRHIELTVPSKICWIRADGANHWTLGCAFQPPLPNHLIVSLAHRGYVERRTNHRKPIQRTAQVRWEMESTWQAVTLLDYSDDGFCMTGLLPSLETSRLLLNGQLAEGEHVELPAQLQWKCRENDTWVCGCQFREPLTRPLKDFLECAPNESPVAEGEITFEQQRVVAYAAALVFGAGLICYLISCLL